MVAFYLLLTQAALTCALHHGLGGPCPMMGMAQPDMAGHGVADPGGMSSHDMPGMPAGGQGPMSLCHCLDNLAAEPPPVLIAAAGPAPLPLLPVLPTAPSRGPVRGSAEPRGPPAPLSA